MNQLTRRQLLASTVAAATYSAFADDPPPAPASSIQFDGDGLIVHRNNDGGDTSQREGWYWFGVWIRQHILKDPWPKPRKLSFAQVLKLLEPQSDGVFYRHPKLPPWNNPHAKDYGYSRDQMVPLVAAMGLWGMTAELRRLWNALPRDPIGGTRHTFNGDWITLLGQRVAHQGDIVLPMTTNLFRRAWDEDPMKAGDGNGPGGEAELLSNVVIRLGIAERDRDDTGDDLNLIVMLLMALLRYPTQITRDAVALYKKRAHSYGSYVAQYRSKYGIDPTTSADETERRIDEGIGSGWKPNVSAPYGAVLWYHRSETGANEELAELYAPIIRAYLE